jgi:dienelactone hydrolase
MPKVLSSILILLFSLPVQAEIVSKPVEYKHAETVLQGLLAYDDTWKDRRPGVLVVHEWWGLNDYVRSRVTQLARLGYVAFALDMYGKDVWTADPNKAKELSSRKFSNSGHCAPGPHSGLNKTTTA